MAAWHFLTCGSRPETHIINYVGRCLLRAARLENAASRLAGDWTAITHVGMHRLDIMLDIVVVEICHGCSEAQCMLIRSHLAT